MTQRFQIAKGDDAEDRIKMAALSCQYMPRTVISRTLQGTSTSVAVIGFRSNSVAIVVELPVFVLPAPKTGPSFCWADSEQFLDPY